MNKRLLAAAAIGMAMGLGLHLLLARTGLGAILYPQIWPDLSPTAEAMRIARVHYIDADAVESGELSHGAINGMLRSLDAFSNHLAVSEVEGHEERQRQRYVGIGVQIERIDERITVFEAFGGGPAAEAGVMAGDQIVEVDGEDTRDFELSEIVGLLEGEAGEAVRLKVRRAETRALLEFELRRSSVNVASVQDIELLDDGIATMRLSRFGERTHEELGEALDRLEADGMRALLIDLRDNPGGLLDSAKEATGEFFEEGEVIVYTQGRKAGERTDYLSNTPMRPRSYPIALLVNGKTASGAELLAGAWQDAGIATLIGETTFGKGAVQSMFMLSDGSAVRLTTAMYFLPSGRRIHKAGVEPDIEVPLEPEQSARLRIVRRHRSMDPERFEKNFGFEPFADEQMEAALESLRAQIQP